jgi:potassium efflux system protein
MKRMNKFLGSLFQILVLSIGFAIALAEHPTPQIPDAAPVISAGLDPTLKSALTVEFLETKIKETEAATDLDEVLTTRLTEQYRKAISALEEASALEAKTAAYKQALEEAPNQARAIREKRASAGTTPTTDLDALPDGATVKEIEQRLAKTQADVAAVGTKLVEIEKELEGGASRPAEARQSIGEAKQELESLEAEIKLPPPEGEPQALTDARRWALVARRQALRSQILMLDQELLSQGARVELLVATRDKAAVDLRNLKAGKDVLEGRLNEMLRARAADAALAAQEAQRQAADKHALVQDLARRNAELSGELTALIGELDRLAGAQEEFEEQTSRIVEAFRSARQRLAAAGMTQTLGQVLIDQRNRLPDLRSYRKAAAERERATTEANLQQIRNNEEQRRLRDVDSYVEELMTGQVTREEYASVQTELRALAEQRRVLLEQASESDETYLRVLGDLDYASSHLMEVAKSYDDFLAERLLWVRSALPVSPATLRDLPTAVLWAIHPANWLEVVKVLSHEASHSVKFWFLLLIVAVLRWKAHAMRRRIRASAEQLRRIRTDSIRYTLQALGLTLLVAAPLSLVLASVGWRLIASLEATSFTKAIGQAAISVSLGLYYLRAFRILCMPGGVADLHFRWSGEVLGLLRRNLDWLLAVLVPLGFVASAAYAQEDAIYSGSLGRLSLIALIIIGLAVFFGRVLNPQHGALHNLIADYPDGWLNRLRKFWYPLVVAIPLTLAVLAAVGYLYAAGILLGSFVSSMYLVLAITVLHQLFIRWLGSGPPAPRPSGCVGAPRGQNRRARQSGRAVRLRNGRAERNPGARPRLAGRADAQADRYAALDRRRRRPMADLVPGAARARHLRGYRPLAL